MLRLMRHLLVCLVLVSVLPSASFAARGFGTTDGAATTDIVQMTHATGQTTMSWCIWAYRTGSGGGGLGRMWDTGNTQLLHDNGNTRYAFNADFSGTDGSWSIVLPSATTWHLVCVTYDGGSLLNDPIMYVDGSSVTVTERTTPVGTHVTNVTANAVGNNTGGAARNWNGRLAEYAIWEGTILTAGNMTSLWNGGAGARMDSLATKPTAYWPICGNASPEPDQITGANVGTVTGTVRQAHPFANCGTGGLLLLGVGQ